MTNFEALMRVPFVARECFRILFREMDPGHPSGQGKVTLRNCAKSPQAAMRLARDSSA